jgi:hypothetical protein
MFSNVLIRLRSLSELLVHVFVLTCQCLYIFDHLLHLRLPSLCHLPSFLSLLPHRLKLISELPDLSLSILQPSLHRVFLPSDYRHLMLNV